MKVISVGDGFQVVLTRDELRIISNALNEVSNGLEVGDLEARLGAEEEEVLDLLRQVKRALRGNTETSA